MVSIFGWHTFCLVGFFWPHCMQDFSSLTRDQSHTPLQWKHAWSHNHWTTKKAPGMLLNINR